ncbi:MAG: 50S ribosomal protein L13 [Anaerolineae bacterium]
MPLQAATGLNEENVSVKTQSVRAEDVARKWYVVDADGKTLGRLASEIASILRGKHKPYFTPHVDCGDFVIVVNAEKIHVTGRRMDQKMYYQHSGYPGGLKSETLRSRLARKPETVIRQAVRLMLPKNTLGRQMLKKLKVYAGPEHPHAAQQPEPLEF